MAVNVPVELDPLTPHRVETGQREGHYVAARRQQLDPVLSGPAGHDRPHLFDERRACRFHGHAGQHGPGGISSCPAIDAWAKAAAGGQQVDRREHRHQHRDSTHALLLLPVGRACTARQRAGGVKPRPSVFELVFAVEHLDVCISRRPHVTLGCDGPGASRPPRASTCGLDDRALDLAGALDRVCVNATERERFDGAALRRVVATVRFCGVFDAEEARVVGDDLRVEY